jgi:hypothetical protein
MKQPIIDADTSMVGDGMEMVGNGCFQFSNVFNRHPNMLNMQRMTSGSRSDVDGQIGTWNSRLAWVTGKLALAMP